MNGFNEKDCTACERCGAFMPEVLARFHVCLGTDLSKRPANISPSRWWALGAEQSLYGNMKERQMRRAPKPPVVRRGFRAWLASVADGIRSWFS